jgi:long-chain-fatty-acid--[acyl-carrier-protein] ligase
VKKVIEWIIAYFFKIILSLRYRVKVQGLEKLTRETLNKPGGVLFLPNHPTYFIDPILVSLAGWPKFPMRPIIVENMYYHPGVHWLMRFIDALPIPNFVISTNSLKRKKSEQIIQTIVHDLKGGQNFLIYPSGKVKHTALESIGGASGVHQIVQETPEANVVLVRIKGLWGSSFSRALTGDAPPMFSTIVQGMKIVLKNLIFFTPRRTVIIDMEPAPADFPYQASRLEMNKYLENWYNRPDGLTEQKGDFPGDSLMLVSYSMWGDKYLPVRDTTAMADKQISIENIPKEVSEKIIHKIAELTEYNPAMVKPAMSLSTDLGMDSLDIAELIAFLQDQFDISGVPPNELTTVSKLMAIASKQVICQEEIEEERSDISQWTKPIKRYRVDIPTGNTMPEVFLKGCARMGNAVAAADARAGVLTYPKFKLRTLIIAEYIRTLPGTYVGILLPSSVAATILIIATQLAGKVPVMINWTVGPRHLESVIKLSDVKVVLTSWAFLDRLENVDLNGIEERLIMLEDVARRFTFRNKLKAFFRSKRSTQSLLKTFNVDHVTKDDIAVLLFTSGTESMPKGVPLSHFNILSNLNSAVLSEEVFSDDIIFGILPPFHSFGFTVSSLLGVLAGVRVFYSPDPTDGRRLIRAFEHWGITIMCGAPTFIKGMLKAAKPEQLKTMRLCVTGAEKAPQDLFQIMELFGKEGCLIEGYGITECSPVLTLNPLGVTPKGVGKALPGIELCIVHPETDELLPNNTQGLILAKGPNVFSGYLNPGLSSPFITIKGETWYKTGDLGFIDDEGFLTISGRMKRFVKLGAEMVSLSSIEDALLQIGAQKQWPLSQEGPSLAICSKESPGEKSKIFLFSQFDISVEEVNKSLREAGFSNLVRVTNVIPISEIPLMGTGKVNYRVLESEYLTKLGII